MSGLLDRIQPHLRDAPPYVPVEPPEEVARRIGLPAGDIVKLDANENPYGPSPRVVEALARGRSYHIYPDPEQRKVRAALASYVGFDPAWLIAGAGSDELIDLLVRLFVPPGGRIVNFPPTFGFYPFLAGVHGARTIDVIRRADFSLDLEGAASAAAEADVVFVASPNNPSGTLLASSELRTLLAAGKPVILDEAYVEFAGESLSGLVREYENLIVLRTLSKWAGLAGLRLGYMIARPELIDVVMRVKQPYSVNVAAEAATLASLGDLDGLQERVRAIVAERERMASLLAGLPGFAVTPSRANFVLCRLDGLSARDVHARLRDRGVLVRYFDTPLLQNHIRVSAGRPDQTDALMRALREIIAPARV